MLDYKGFKARVEYIRELGLYAAEVNYGNDVISFAASNFKDLPRMMEEAVEDYLDYYRQKIVKLSGTRQLQLSSNSC